ncbi:hypothetical protein VTJ83DRAFT_770 [Remersonia thermophila]|uniref:Uncharacterized protein n=1 Tax=Remersonia thermophila TaxID=72144 RepID=A0ABR4DMS4_9PEZI
MGRLPPAEKLPLALRKNIRDEFDSNKADLESQLSELLGTEWTVEVDPLAIWPYHNDGWAKENLGSAIKGYINGAIYQLKNAVSKYGDEFKTELNALAPTHILTLDFDEEGKISSGGCGVDIHEGKLRILFAEDYLGTNVDYCLENPKLLKALNAVPPTEELPYSFVVRQGIRERWDAEIGEVKAKIAAQLGKSADDITLNPNFAATFDRLTQATEANENIYVKDWQDNFASFILGYFDALRSHLEYVKVGEDELVQEGLLEAVEKNEYAFRLVDSLQDSSYNEVVIEDGVLYLQTTPENFGVNQNDVAKKLVDRL